MRVIADGDSFAPALLLHKFCTSTAQHVMGWPRHSYVSAYGLPCLSFSTVTCLAERKECVNDLSTQIFLTDMVDDRRIMVLTG